MKLILVGHGRMGKMIEELLAPREDVELLGVVAPGLFEKARGFTQAPVNGSVRREGS